MHAGNLQNEGMGVSECTAGGGRSCALLRAPRAMQPSNIGLAMTPTELEGAGMTGHGVHLRLRHGAEPRVS